MDVKYFAMIIGASIFIIVLELIRRHKMTFRYSLSWLSASIVVLFFSLNPQLLFHLSKTLGFQLPSNFIFFCMISFFVYLSLGLTLYINEQNSRTEALAQHLGILKLKLETLERTRA